MTKEEAGEVMPSRVVLASLLSSTILRSILSDKVRDRNRLGKQRETHVVMPISAIIGSETRMGLPS
ncbi:hypothetical protein E2P64_08280 [Candidatus Bathyarchaeota archaeon]|nr:hypothetical protein E2P64_08280 [Candidatus Bathyarchaeota archaeon]